MQENMISIGNYLINLDNVNYAELEVGNTGNARVWFQNRAVAHEHPHLDLTGQDAESIRNYARSGVMRLYPDRIETGGGANFTLRPHKAMTAGGGGAGA